MRKTGKGHGTDVAVLLGLCNEDPVTIDVNVIDEKIKYIQTNHQLKLGNEFNYNTIYPFVFLAIKLDDGGSIFLIQERIGRNNKKIKILLAWFSRLATCSNI